MAASLTACGGSGKASDTSSSGEERTGEASGEGFKVGLITDVGGVNDGSFNQSAWEGLQRAMDELDIEASYLESETDADYVPNMETFVDEEYDLIISVGYMLADATKTAAESNPDITIQQFNANSFADSQPVRRTPTLRSPMEQILYSMRQVRPASA